MYNTKVGFLVAQQLYMSSCIFFVCVFLSHPSKHELTSPKTNSQVRIQTHKTILNLNWLNVLRKSCTVPYLFFCYPERSTTDNSAESKYMASSSILWWSCVEGRGYTGVGWSVMLTGKDKARELIREGSQGNHGSDRFGTIPKPQPSHDL